MSGLDDIGVSVEGPGPAGDSTGNAVPILHEVLHALRRLAETGEPTVIDLNAIPFAPGDEDQLLGVLGRGEVDVRMQALGETRIWESVYSGAWVIEHANPEGERLAFHIEVSRVPSILGAQPEDIREAVEQLQRRLTRTEQ